MGFEPTTCSLRVSCSTAELKRQFDDKSNQKNLWLYYEKKIAIHYRILHKVKSLLNSYLISLGVVKL